MAKRIDIQGSLRKAAVLLASGGVRLMLLLLALLFMGWQLYFFGWRPLSQQSVLPVGVEVVEARLNITTLQEIQDLRVQRIQHQPIFFTGAEQYFPEPATPPGRSGDD